MVTLNPLELHSFWHGYFDNSISLHLASGEPLYAPFHTLRVKQRTTISLQDFFIKQILHSDYWDVNSNAFYSHFDIFINASYSSWCSTNAFYTLYCYAIQILYTFSIDVFINITPHSWHMRYKHNSRPIDWLVSY